MADYPSSITNLADTKVDGTTTAGDHAAHHDAIVDEIKAIETELGTLPKGSFTDVKTRLAASIINVPGSAQTITPTADVVALRVKQGNNTYPSDLTEWLDSTGAVKAYVDKSGNFSAQSFLVNGTAIASTNLSDSGVLQRKGKIASNIAQSSESMAVGWDIVAGVTPGRTSATPQNTLQVSADNTDWNLTIHLGAAHIQGTDDVAQGMYGIVQNTAYTLALGTHAPATNPRIDAIVVQYNDSNYTGRSPADTFSFQQVVGTPTSGATLVNLLGAPAVPASSLLLAYLLVNTTDTGAQNANVSDQRILSGPAVWGEDNHKYRIGVDSGGNLFLGQVS